MNLQLIRFHSDLFCSSRKRRRRSVCSSTLYLHLYWASRGWGAAVLLCSLDTAKLAERASVKSSMGNDSVKSIKSESQQCNFTEGPFIPVWSFRYNNVVYYPLLKKRWTNITLCKGVSLIYIWYSMYFHDICPCSYGILHLFSMTACYSAFLHRSSYIEKVGEEEMSVTWLVYFMVKYGKLI